MQEAVQKELMLAYCLVGMLVTLLVVDLVDATVLMKVAVKAP